MHALWYFKAVSGVSFGRGTSRYLMTPPGALYWGSEAKCLEAAVKIALSSGGHLLALWGTDKAKCRSGSPTSNYCHQKSYARERVRLPMVPDVQ